VKTRNAVLGLVLAVIAAAVGGWLDPWACLLGMLSVILYIAAVHEAPAGPELKDEWGQVKCPCQSCTKLREERANKPAWHARSPYGSS